MLNRYIKTHEHDLADLFNEDVFIEKYRIMRGSHLKKLFLEEFAYMPIEKRIERIKKIVQTEVKRKAKAVLTSLNTRYEDMIGKALSGLRDPDKRRETVTKFIDERDERIPKITAEAKSTATTYMKRFEKAKIKQMYRKLLTDRQLLQELAPEWTFEQQEKFLQTHAKEKWALEDLAAIYYLQAKVKGIADQWKMRVVFIDEVQDYSLFQLAALQDGLETDMFTMVGDLAQGIHSYRSLTEWDSLLELFPRANYFTLQKSYRTTIEIMEVANKILMKMDEDLPLVEPVVRHGQEPTFVQGDTFAPEKISEIYQSIGQNGHKSIALICKTTAEAANYTRLLNNAGVPAEMLNEESALGDAKLLIVPSHLAKGLEFDAVIIAAFDIPYFDTAIDRKLLYVALTRAMHELYLVGPGLDVFYLMKYLKQ